MVDTLYQYCQQCCHIWRYGDQHWQYGDQYCDNILQRIVNFDNIVTIYDNNFVKQYCENCQCCDYIVEYSHYNIPTISFAIFSNLTTLLTILLHYCYFVTILSTILRSVMVMKTLCIEQKMCHFCPKTTTCRSPCIKYFVMVKTMLFFYSYYVNCSM